MAKELTQLDRALRFAIKARGTPDNSVVRLQDEDLLDAKAIAEEFERLLNDAVKRAEHARKIGREKGGRPPSKKPSAAALAKRKSRAKQKAEKPE